MEKLGNAGHERNCRPHPKLPFAATRVLKASGRLGATEKLVWLEMYALDNTDLGCYAKAVVLGDRLGKREGTIENVRLKLTRYGLLKSIRRTGITSWYPTMPADCIPNTARPTPDDIQRLAAIFDTHTNGVVPRIRGDRLHASVECKKVGVKVGDKEVGELLPTVHTTVENLATNLRLEKTVSMNGNSTTRTASKPWETISRGDRGKVFRGMTEPGGTRAT